MVFKEKDKAQFSIASGYHLEFNPVFKYDGFDDVVQFIKVYFVNQSPELVQFHYECKAKINTLHEVNEGIPAYSKHYLNDIPYELMHDQPTFNWKIERKIKNSHHIEEGSLRIKPKKLYDIIHQLQLKENPSFTIGLSTYQNLDALDAPWDDSTTQKLKDIDFGIEKNDQQAINNNVRNYEIDLHIENLVDDTTDMDNFEMLSIQIEAFENAVNQAIQNNFPHLTIIHGVGKGRLKEAIHNTLKTKYNIHNFIHDWTPQYGNGATQIIF